MRSRRSLLALVALALVGMASGCAGTPAPAPRPATGVHTLPGTTPVHLTASVTHPASMSRLSGALAAAGLHLEWHTGEPLASIDGTATAVERYFDVALTQATTPTGSRYYTASSSPRIPGVVTAALGPLLGFDGQPVHRNMLEDNDIGDGYTAADMVGMYDVGPLHAAGDLGQGQTIVMIEIDTIAQRSDLTAYAADNNLPPFNITIETNAAAWGQAATTDVGESNLDVEIAHAIAPDAHLVLYETDGNPSDLLSAAQAAINAYPHAVISESLGICEGQDEEGSQELASQESELAEQLEQGGGSWFVASGDSAAYGCSRDVGNSNPLFTSPSVNALGNPAEVTSVGGTTAFLGANQTYGSEDAWGEPLERAGSGGGVSQVVSMPSYQTGPGVENSFSNGNREQPDVAADGDPLTGWRIIVGGQIGSFAGTSAAAPLWAAATALIDNRLEAQHLSAVGETNPALYSFFNNAASEPASPFHDVTSGSNFVYPATRGYDMVTGLGTPDVAHLATDWAAYEKAAGS